MGREQAGCPARCALSGAIRYDATKPGGANGSKKARTPVMKSFDATKLTRLLLALLIAAAATVAAAQERGPGQGGQRRPQQQSEQHGSEQQQGPSRESVLRLLPADSVTEHAVDIPAGKL